MDPLVEHWRSRSRESDVRVGVLLMPIEASGDRVAARATQATVVAAALSVVLWQSIGDAPLIVAKADIGFQPLCYFLFVLCLFFVGDKHPTYLAVATIDIIVVVVGISSMEEHGIVRTLSFVSELESWHRWRTVCSLKQEETY